jgi:hypothetical protein
MIPRTFALLPVLFLAGVSAAEPPPAKPADPPPPAKEPSLDDLLGLPGDAKSATPSPQPAPAVPPAPDSAKAELDRRLKTEEVNEEFEQAVALMGEVATRLTGAGDTGLETQRLQQDTLRRLDKLIDDAQKNQNRSRSKSKSKQQQQQQQQPGQQSSQQQAQSPRPSNQAGDPSVPMQSGALKPPPPASAASWGNLPEHLRQALTQGRSDRFSSIYQQLTEQYYKRLAEERRAGGPR